MGPPIMSNDPHRKVGPDHVILDVEGARDVGPTEAAGLIRECLTLTYQRLDAATWRALDELSAGTPDHPGSVPPPSSSPSRAVKTGRAVRGERSKFFPRFRSEFDQLFQARRQGKPREHAQRGTMAATLALVDEQDLTGQVALKSAVQTMRTAIRNEGFGFDLRARIVMREQPSEGEYENPWGCDLVCDALGNTCRALWAADDAWRPIMEYLVIALTPEIVALHRDLNALLQDRDILPVLRVHARKRGSANAEAQLGTGSLYDKVVELLARDTSTARGMPASPAQAHSTDSGAVARSRAVGDPNAWRMPADTRRDDASGATADSAPWSALLGALSLLERQPPGSPDLAPISGVDLAALRNGTANALPALARATAGNGGSALGRATIEILSAVLDEVFDNPHMPPEIKTVFGRLQIPMLKAALLDRQVLSQPRHRVRRFFDALAAASVGLRPDHARDALFIELANHLASIVRDRFDDNLEIFATARDELETFLDTERAAYNEKLVQVLPSLIALDDHAAALARVQTAMAMRLAGKNVPAEIRAYLDHEGLDRMTAAFLRGGPEGKAWREELRLVDDLLWSIAPEPGPQARRRLVQLVPLLVRSVGENWPADEVARARREVFLARLYQLHIDAIKALPDLPDSDDRAPAAGPSGIVAQDPSPPPENASSSEDPDEIDALMRGDWCVFRGAAETTPVLAKFAWRAPRGTQLLFTHRDGTTAVIHTPRSLAQAFGSGRAKVAVEAAPLFERAMERVIERRAHSAPSPFAMPPIVEPTVEPAH